MCCRVTDGEFNFKEKAFAVKCTIGVFMAILCVSHFHMCGTVWPCFGWLLYERIYSHWNTLHLPFSLSLSLSLSAADPSFLLSQSTVCTAIKKKTHHSTAFNTSVLSLPTSRCVCLLSPLCPVACVLYLSMCYRMVIDSCWKLAWNTSMLQYVEPILYNAQSSHDHQVWMKKVVKQSSVKCSLKQMI